MLQSAAWPLKPWQRLMIVTKRDSVLLRPSKRPLFLPKPFKKACVCCCSYERTRCFIHILRWQSNGFGT